MERVHTLNQLIPSNQLDETLLGHNLEIVTSDELGTGQEYTKDSIRNMLSDKDPMLGSASSHYHLLDKDDANCQISGSSGVEVMKEPLSGRHTGNQRGRGRGRGRGGGGITGRGGGVTGRGGITGRGGHGRGRGPSPYQAAQGMELFENDLPNHVPGVWTKLQHQVPQARRGGAAIKSAMGNKTTSSCGKRGAPKVMQHKPGRGRPRKRGDITWVRGVLNTKALPWYLNPVVVLRRLTVTVGGYKIELLPGPSAMTWAEGTGVQPHCFRESPVCGSGLELTGERVVASQSLSPAHLGPFVNPNDVQQGSLPGSAVVSGEKLPETKANGEVADGDVGLGGEQESPAKENLAAGETLVPPAAKDGHRVKKRLKSGPAGFPVVQKRSMTGHLAKEGVKPKFPSPETTGHEDIHKLNPPDGKRPYKRRGERLKTHPPAKMHKQHPEKRLGDGGKVTLCRNEKLSVPRDSPTKKLPLPAAGTCESRGPHQPAISKPSRTPVPRWPIPVFSSPILGSHQKEVVEDLQQEKHRGEKPAHKKGEKGEKGGAPRHRIRSSRSLSLDEPQLFIPDNAPLPPPPPPVAKSDVPEEGEAAWDPSKHCGFCKKPHSNRLMVGCGRCDDWFHGDCVGLDLAKAQQMEQEDQEYVCLTCCAEEDKRSRAPSEGPARAEGPHRQGLGSDSKPAAGQDRKELLNPGTTGVRIIKKETMERKPSVELGDADSKMASLSDQKSSLALKASQAHGDSNKKTAQEKPEVKKIKSSPTTSKKPSVEQIRRSVRDSLKEILLKRIKESNLTVPLEKASSVATQTEKGLFAFFKDTDSKYKSKYRSLMFNLNDAKNNVLFKRVLNDEISPEHLIRMSPEELASKELAAWRQRENRHTIEMIEKEQREVERRPITKITHKGEIEIESQEAVKPAETAVGTETVPRSVEEPKPKEVPVEKESEDCNDTTGQHKAHLFDLNCKICTGRMAPPAEDATTKAVKVATTVMRRQSGVDAEAPSTQLEELSLATLEECLSNPSVLSLLDGSSDSPKGRQDEAAFLARLDLLWTGCVNMPSVAKFFTKMYPVSGVLDHLTEDLPNSIQVGGRISPQTVWDYVEKIRASGTKEVCLIRFSPATEEDEISYTLLYAYFSSRRRYGVVANNTKQVKDSYLIPLGTTDKIPHQLVPFDGPGLEANRSNLLLGLIIRQRVRRDFSTILPVDVPEVSVPRLVPEGRAKAESAFVDSESREGEQVDPLSEGQLAESVKQQPASVDAGDEAGKEADSLTSESVLQEAVKAPRFLPGVLVGGQSGASAPSQNLAGKNSLSEAEQDVDKQAPAPAATSDGVRKELTLNKSPAPNGPRLDRFIIKKKESKVVVADSKSVVHTTLAADDLKTSAADSKPPLADSKPPLADSIPPLADSIPPLADSIPPVAELNLPVADWKPPVAELNLPVADWKPPVAELNLPVVDLKPPVVDSKPVVVDTKPVAANSKMAGADSEPPAAETKPAATDSEQAAAVADSRPAASADSKSGAALDSKPVTVPDSKPGAACNVKLAAATESKLVAVADCKLTTELKPPTAELKMEEAEPNLAITEPKIAAAVSNMVVAELKRVVAEELSGIDEKLNASALPATQASTAGSVATTAVSLKDKPPDVSTEAFLASLSPAVPAKELADIHTLPLPLVDEEVKSNPVDLEQKAAAEMPCTPSKDCAPAPAIPSPIKDPKTVPGAILKNSTHFYGKENQGSSVDGAPGDISPADGPQDQEVKETEKPLSDSQERSEALRSPVSNEEKPSVPPLVVASPKQEFRPLEDIQSITTVSSDRRGCAVSGIPSLLSPLPTAYSQGGLRLSAPKFPVPHATSAPFKYHPPPSPGFRPQTGSVPPFKPLHQPAPPSLVYPAAPPLRFPQSEPHVQNHAMSWPHPAPLLAGFPPPGPPPPLASFQPPVSAVPFEASHFVESSAKDERGPERRHSDPWDRRHRLSEDDHQRSSSEERHRHRHLSESHREKKSRHRKDRDHDRDRRKHRRRSRSRSRTRSRTRSWSRSRSRSRSRARSRSRKRSREKSSRRHSRSHHRSRKDSHHRHRHRKDSHHDRGRNRSKDRRS